MERNAPMSTEQNPFEEWSKLIAKTMKCNPVIGSAFEPSREGEKDPWLALIDQLWKANPYSRLIPYDPAEVTRAFQQLWLDAARNPPRAWAAYSNFVQQYSQIMASASLAYWGRGQRQNEPVITPEKGDKRFSAPDWQQNPVFDALKQSYLLTATTLLKSAAQVQGLDEHQQRKMIFYLRQFLDAISPNNFAF